MNIENIDQSRTNKREDGRIKQIEGLNGAYKILYGVHDGAVQDKPISVGQMDNMDGLILEDMGINSNFQKYPSTVVAELQQMYKGVMHAAIEKGMPVFLVDASSEFAEQHKNDETKLKLLAALESILGISIIAVSSKVISQPITRREFLKRSAILAISGYFFLPSLKEGAASLISNNPTIRNISRAVDASHPEMNSTIVEGRNCLFAQKSETISKSLQKEVGHKPRIAICIGAAHYGLENDLASGEETRVAKLKSYKDLCKNDESLIIRIDFKKEENSEGKNLYKINISLIRDPEIKKCKI